jgi:rubrerythrin
MELLPDAFLPTKVVRGPGDVTDDELLKMGREQERFAIELYDRQAKWSWVRTVFDPLMRIVKIEEDHQTQFEASLKKIGARPYELIPAIRFDRSVYGGLNRLAWRELDRPFLGEALQVVINDHFQEVFASLHYDLAAQWAKDPAVKQLFGRIKKSEDAHQRAFERLHDLVAGGKVEMFCPFCGELLDAAGHCWACGMSFSSLALTAKAKAEGPGPSTPGPGAA